MAVVIFDTVPSKLSESGPFTDTFGPGIFGNSGYITDTYQPDLFNGPHNGNCHAATYHDSTAWLTQHSDPPGSHGATYGEWASGPFLFDRYKNYHSDGIFLANWWEDWNESRESAATSWSFGGADFWLFSPFVDKVSLTFTTPDYTFVNPGDTSADVNDTIPGFGIVWVVPPSDYEGFSMTPFTPNPSAGSHNGTEIGRTTTGASMTLDIPLDLLFMTSPDGGPSGWYFYVVAYTINYWDNIDPYVDHAAAIGDACPPGESFIPQHEASRQAYARANVGFESFASWTLTYNDQEQIDTTIAVYKKGTPAPVHEPIYSFNELCVASDLNLSEGDGGWPGYPAAYELARENGAGTTITSGSIQVYPPGIAVGQWFSHFGSSGSDFVTLGHPVVYEALHRFPASSLSGELQTGAGFGCEKAVSGRLKVQWRLYGVSNPSTVDRVFEVRLVTWDGTTVMYTHGSALSSLPLIGTFTVPAGSSGTGFTVSDIGDVTPYMGGDFSIVIVAQDMTDDVVPANGNVGPHPESTAYPLLGLAYCFIDAVIERDPSTPEKFQLIEVASNNDTPYTVPVMSQYTSAVAVDIDPAVEYWVQVGMDPFAYDPLNGTYFVLEWGGDGTGSGYVPLGPPTAAPNDDIENALVIDPLTPGNSLPYISDPLTVQDCEPYGTDPGFGPQQTMWFRFGPPPGLRRGGWGVLLPVVSKTVWEQVGLSPFEQINSLWPSGITDFVGAADGGIQGDYMWGIGTGNTSSEQHLVRFDGATWTDPGLTPPPFDGGAGQPYTGLFSGCCYAAGKLWFGGGQFISSPVGFWSYDFASDTWTQHADCPAPAPGAYPMLIAHSNGKIYMIGGLNQTPGKCYEYDIGANTWTVKADVPATDYPGTAWDPGFSNWAGSGIVEHPTDGKIHLFGGDIPGPAVTSRGHTAFDPVGNAWDPPDYIPMGLDPNDIFYPSDPINYEFCGAWVVDGNVIIANAWSSGNIQSDTVLDYDWSIFTFREHDAAGTNEALNAVSVGIVRGNLVMTTDYPANVRVTTTGPP